MGTYIFICAFLSGCMMIFALYFLIEVLIIHKNIFNKYFYFAIACITASAYIFNHYLVCQPFTNDIYLISHRFKWICIIIFLPFYSLTTYECFFPEANRIIPKILIIIMPIFVILTQTKYFLSLPIKTLEINIFNVTFFYRFGTSQILYKTYGIIMLLSMIISIIYYLFSKIKNKKLPFLLIYLFMLISAINDLSISYGFYKSILTNEYLVTASFTFVFIYFILENKKTQLSVIVLKDEAIRRLRITEIYTRKSLVESIEKGEDPTKFQPNNVQIATLFTDIRDFTGISEGLQPLEVVELLNSYFNRMNSSIIKHKGEIDKLMGDCIMALFKDPDDALKSAIEIRTELAKFNLGTHQRQINNGIGLNFGEVIIGNIGSESKMDYTVVGDIVNTASRLEALTKYYKVPLIISEDLKVQLKNNYQIRFLDEALIKGKSTPVKIYEVYDFESDEKKETRQRNEKPLQTAFALYQAGEFLKAIEIYQKLGIRNDELEIKKGISIIPNSSLQIPNSAVDPILNFYIKRCQNLQSQKEAGLLKEWNGVFEFMDK